MMGDERTEYERWEEAVYQYDPYREQDLQPWERDFESRYAFDPESEEA